MLTLIGTEYTTDDIGQQIPQEIPRDVFCRISSVSASEWLEVGQLGLRAEYRATMFRHDYQGEELAELDGARYGIYRTYETKGDTIELYLEHKAGVSTS